MRVLTATRGSESISVTTEHEETLALNIIGKDGRGNFAVQWEEPEKWMAGQFVDRVVDAPELYPVQNIGDEFDCDDGSVLTAVQNSDGGFSWEEKPID